MAKRVDSRFASYIVLVDFKCCYHQAHNATPLGECANSFLY